MKNKYLAKSNGETIIEHTKKLVENLALLKAINPSIKVNWDLLFMACAFHDLGKMNKLFQQKVEMKVTRNPKEIPHGLLSTMFIPVKKLEETYAVEEIKALVYAVAYHHNRNLSEIDKEEIKKQAEEIKVDTAGFLMGLHKSEKMVSSILYNILGEIQVQSISKRYFEIGARIYAAVNQDVADNYIMLKGLLNRLDYAASANIDVENRNDFLIVDMEKMLESWNKIKKTEWNSLQKFMLNHQDENIVAVAQTGKGKTEAGLLWLGNQKGFFTLPLRTAINAIYGRLKNNVFMNEFERKIGVLHSETYGQYLALDNKKSTAEIDEYYTRTKQMTLPLTICTIDQIFDFVFRYDGFEVKLATLSYSKVIIDEIQMYAPDLLAYLITGLRYIQYYGGKFAILTATLPGIVLHFLDEEKIKYIQPSKPFIDVKIRHRVKIMDEQINSNLIKTKYKKNKILVICNTVKKAKEIYKELEETYQDEVNLFHSQFIKKDREGKEKKILALGQKECNDYGIWITTQVVEASLDIDFDLLFTELSDLAGLFQRFGRCYRNREIERSLDYNCYIYDGGDSKCSGIGYVIDKEIYGISKETLRNTGQENFDEELKIRMIEQTYSKEKLENTEYFKSIKNNITYLKRITEGEIDKNEVLKKFRNINSLDVIPQGVYQENKKEIDQLVEFIGVKSSKAISMNRVELQQQKIIAREELNQYKVSVPGYIVEGNRKTQIEVLSINKYEKVNIFDCNYTKEEGITLKDLEKENTFF